MTSKPPDEMEIVKRQRRKAFVEMYHRQEKMVVRYATAKLRSVPDAHEVAADVFAYLYRRFMRGVEPHNERAFVAAAARRKIIDFVRAQKRRLRLVPIDEAQDAAESGVADDLEARRQLDELASEIDALEPDEQDLLDLGMDGGLPATERGKLFRLREFLRQRIDRPRLS